MKAGDIQAIVTYKWSDNIIRTKVSTLRLEYLRENQIVELGKRFDEQAAAVMLGRMVSRKTEIEDTL
jgi:protein transport protein SEC23